MMRFGAAVRQRPTVPVGPREAAPVSVEEAPVATNRQRIVKRKVFGTETVRAAAFLADQVPLALIAATRPEVATVHALATFAVGAWWATSSPRMERVAWVAAYMAGAEVLWRMTGAQTYWEFGKYGAVAIFVLSILRTRKLTPAILPFTYFALLIPSIALTVSAETFSGAREQISFNLSGPLALMVAAWFFSHAQLTGSSVRTMFIAFIGPAIGVATLAAKGTFAGDVVFYNASNMATSGGYGPNQVSAVLGLAAMLALFIALDAGIRTGMRGLMIAVMGWTAAQSALTFSRSGMYMSAAGAGLAICLLMGDRRFRSKLIPIAVVIFTVGNYFVVPYLDAFTDGAIGERFQDVYLTGRDRMIKADIELWKRNPILGVGPGEGRAFRGESIMEGRVGRMRGGPPNLAAHTEFSRLLSEHGLLGLAALGVLLFAGFRNVTRMPDRRTQALVAAFGCWSALFMLGDGMRILAPSFVFAIGFAALLADNVATDSSRVPVQARQPRRRPLIVGHPSLKGVQGS
jgi:hypothetical protein